MSKRAWILCFAVLCITAVTAAPASAHFGMVITSDSMVMQEDFRTLDLKLSFSHPFEGIGMDMEKPEQFAVYHGEQKTDLTGKLKKTEVMGKTGWQTNYPVKRPGTYVFAMTPRPYWEPAEDLFIIHYTKTYVTAFGDDTGWDREIGLPAEIVPLSKPFALYAGNVFQGVVKVNGEPVPHAEVEVEYDNRNGNASAPTDYFITQTVKADKNGVFTYAAPAAGWWGFSALQTADYQLEKNGKKKDVEIGGVIWVKFHKWQDKGVDK